MVETDRIGVCIIPYYYVISALSKNYHDMEVFQKKKFRLKPHTFVSKGPVSACY